MERAVSKVYLGVGSNLGDRAGYLNRAREFLKKVPATRFLRSSTVIETDPVGGPPQGKYLNAVWELETELSPEALKRHLLSIESSLGRRRKDPNAPREIDLDLLFYGDTVVRMEDLKIPHPRLQNRGFVLRPLAELAPGWMHPILKETVASLLRKFEESCRR